MPEVRKNYKEQLQAGPIKDQKTHRPDGAKFFSRLIEGGEMGNRAKWLY